MLTITTLSLLAASAGAAFALPLAQPAQPEPARVRVLQPSTANTDGMVISGSSEPITIYTGAPNNQPVTSSGSVMISQDDGNESFIIRIDNGQVIELKRNGQDIDPNHFTFDGDKIQILDDDGNVVQTHDLHVQMPDLPPVPGLPRILSFGQGGNFVLDRDNTARFFTDASGNQVTWDFQPKVMVGINQGVPDAALRYQLGLGEDQKCILIEKVIEGLPADRAGLHRYDIVVKVDGKAADDATLRDILAEKEPGQAVTFNVIRQGKPVELKIELEAYDSDKLMTSVPSIVPDVNSFLRDVPSGRGWVVAPSVPSTPSPPGVAQAPSDEVYDFTFEADDFADPAKAPEAIRRLREKIQQHADRAKLDGDRLMILRDAQAERADKMRIKAMEMAESAGQQVDRTSKIVSDKAINEFVPATKERMDRLEKRLDELDRSLSDRLEKLLDRLDSISNQLKPASGDSEKEEI